MTSPEPRRIRSQAGFSMIEMLMTAFILAVGLLGLAMFQTMALRATRGNRSINTAVLVANQILDQAEMEGRVTWLNETNSPSTGGSNANFTNLKYVTLANGTTYVEHFNSQGGAVDSTSTDPSVNTNFFTATTEPAAQADADGSTGKVSLFTVTVAFNDTQNSNNTPYTRQVVINRSITHG